MREKREVEGRQTIITQTDRQTDRHTDRQTDRQRKHRQTKPLSHLRHDPSTLILAVLRGVPNAECIGPEDLHLLRVTAIELRHTLREGGGEGGEGGEEGEGGREGGEEGGRGEGRGGRGRGGGEGETRRRRKGG